VEEGPRGSNQKQSSPEEEGAGEEKTVGFARREKDVGQEITQYAIWIYVLRGLSHFMPKSALTFFNSRRELEQIKRAYEGERKSGR
jgi:hypothetical protein